MKPAFRQCLTKRLRLQVLERDGYSCRYCGKTGDATDLWVDHVLAVERGGTNSYANLVAACMHCNLLKGAHGGGWLIEAAPEHLRTWWGDFLANPPELTRAMSDNENDTPQMPEAAREWMRTIASKKTPARTAASRANAAIARAARTRDPMTLPCICSSGDSLEADAHTWTCPRGRLLKQRQKAAQKKAAST